MIEIRCSRGDRSSVCPRIPGGHHDEHLHDLGFAAGMTNAALAAYSIQEELRSNELTEIRAVYGVYLLDTRQIWAPRVGSIEGGGLAAPPVDFAEFAELGEAIMRSRRNGSLIDALTSRN